MGRDRPGQYDHLGIAQLAADDPRQVGPFQLLGRLGAGGMGQVYLGQTPGGRLVAVKVVHAAFAGDPAFRRRFRHEVDLVRRVHGPCTAAFVDADPDASPPWLATAYVPGPSLREAVDDLGAWPTSSVYFLGGGIAEALMAIHAAGVVHRDLKPGNVLLAYDGPRVIDFGIARAVDATHLTGLRQGMGTAGFTAPEQALGRDVGGAADVFALGALLAYAATGRSPFGDGPTDAVLYRVVHSPPDLHGIDDDLRDLIEACLDKNPDRRPTPAVILQRCRGATDATEPSTRGLPDRLTIKITRRTEVAEAVRRSASRPRGVLRAVTALVLVATATAVIWYFAPGDPSPRPSAGPTPAQGVGAHAGQGPATPSASETRSDPTATPPAPTPGGTTPATTPSRSGSSGTGGPTRGRPGPPGPRPPSTAPTHRTTNSPTPTPPPTRPVLIGVGVNAQPRSGTVSCGPTQTVIFTASVAAQRAGTINYAWRPDDRVDASPRTGSMTFDGAQEKHTQFTVPRNGTSGQRLQGNVIFQVTAPEADRQLAGDEFDLTCQ